MIVEPEENASTKIDEAKFYLELMDQIEGRRQPLTNERELSVEFSYLLSAFLNACYSCTEHLKLRNSNRDRVVTFRRAHSEFYASGPNGGWRTKTVHFRNVGPTSDGYHPPPGNNVILRFREKAEPEAPGEPANLSFGPGYFYFSESGQQNSICDLCAVHIPKLQELVWSCS